MNISPANISGSLAAGTGGGLAGIPNPINSNSEVLSLRWNSHEKNVLSMFSRLLDTEQFSDVLISAEGKFIRAHKVVLSASSSYFDDLFLNFSNSPNLSPQQQIVVFVKDAPYSDVVSIVEFMYKGSIAVPQSRLASVLKTADSLGVRGLTEVAAKSLAESVFMSMNNMNAANMAAQMTASSAAFAQALALAQLNKTNPGFPLLDETNAPGMKTTTTNASVLPTDLSVKQKDLDLSSSFFGGASPPRMSDIESKISTTKRKRGRPRTLDSPGDNNLDLSSNVLTSPSKLIKQNLKAVRKSPSISTTSMAPPPPALSQITSSNLNAATGSEENLEEFVATNAPMSGGGQSEEFSVPPMPTPGGPLTPERMSSLGIIKMNDYLVTGSRQQFWEEYYVKVVMQAVRNKEVDMKGAADLLGVSYGTLYGRYRETFGYLKHSWNIGGRPSSTAATTSSTATLKTLKLGGDDSTENLVVPSPLPNSSFPVLPLAGFPPPLTTTSASALSSASVSGAASALNSALAPGSLGGEAIFELLKAGKITLKQAASIMGLDTSMLAFQLTTGVNDSTTGDANDEIADKEDENATITVGAKSDNGNSITVGAKSDTGGGNSDVEISGLSEKENNKDDSGVGDDCEEVVAKEN